MPRGRSPSPRDRRYDTDERSRRRSRSRSPVNKRRKYSRSPLPVPRRRSRSRSHDYDRRRSQSNERHHSHWDRPRSEPISSASSVDKKRRKKRRSSKERQERKERKREKREKKDRKKKSGASQWGKYGIISETDIFSKGSEFHTWLVEEQKINPETISKDQSRKQFSKFVEDYNTGTLPSEKYYDMESYERRMSALRSGEFVPPSDTYDPRADMKAINSAHKKRPAEHDSYMSKEQLQELRRVQNERVEAGKMKLLGMDIKQNMGVRMDGSTFDE